jgi:hypothetical protein
MSPKEPTWFVRLQGHILGPLSTEQLKASLREGDINLSDKINRSGENSWQVVGDHEELAAYWKTHRARAPSFEIPSPNILWKKPPPQAEEIPVPIPAPIPAPPAAIKLVEIPVVDAPQPEKKQKSKPAKKSSAQKTEIKAEPVLAPAPEPAIISAPIPAPFSEPIKAEEPKFIPKKQDYRRAPAPVIEYSHPPEKSDVEKEIIRILETQKLEARKKAQEAVAAFPQRPEVPEQSHDYNFREENAPVRKKKFESPVAMEWQKYSQDKRLHIAAAIAVLLLVAGIAYWAGQKTRDLKELPLSDPSSPTTQLPAASDPIQPLKAPTRPQRD